MAKLHYLIPRSDVESEERRILAALSAGGYAAEGLDLSGLARQAVTRAAMEWVAAIDIEIIDAEWAATPDGGAAIQFRFRDQDDAERARLALD